ncbi:MAG: RHS repeat-associated core domain-containing protein [Cytophagales bacterium]|nr:RHS repeat-associated core domain-containing protein [Cytophagales bacterium]
MKRILFLLLTVMGFMHVQAQTSTKNYIMSMRARQALTGTLQSQKSKQDSVQTNITYFDGLGRPEQINQHRASVSNSGTPGDIIMPYFYDNYGRQIKQGLPFEVNASGNYQSNAMTQLEAEYDATRAVGIPEIDNPYTETKFEDSSLGRTMKTASPGDSWKMSGDHTVDFLYRANITSDSIQDLDIDQSGYPIVSDYGIYTSGELWMVEINDEDNHKVYEFKDKEGRVICKKIENGAEDAITYYLYDDFGQLTMVVSPEAVSQIIAVNEWTKLNDAKFRDQWLYIYRYDERGRMIEKKVPGAAPVEMVYDARDRIVLTLDGNRRNGGMNSGTIEHVESGLLEVTEYQGKSYTRAPGAKILFKKPDFETTKSDGFFGKKASNAPTSKWIYTKYDALNRPVMTGIIALTESRQSLQDAIDNDSGYDFSVAYIGNGSGNIYGYDNTSYPSTTGTEILSVTYYDNYDFITHQSWGNNYTHTGHHTATKGLVTGGLVKVLGTSTYLKSATYYDNRLRPTLVASQNYVSGVDRILTTYRNDVSPLIENTTTTHVSSGVTTTVLEEFTYDHRDRPTKVQHKINSEPKVTLSEFTYNLVGQMIEKDLHGGAAQSVDYAYNERGWIKTINGGMAGDGDVNDRFFLELNYDDAPTPQYEGNIGQMLWKTMGRSENENQQSYDYSYDDLNRLTKATYNSTGKANYFNVGGNDNGNISYDLNGNIKSLKRYHEGTLIDDLSFSHSGNRITSAADAASDTGEGFIEASNGLVAGEYQYDANGNITKDANKGLTLIDYNILNLPRQVTEANGDVITYIYDAAGTKLAKTIDDGSPETSYYDGPFHYIGNALQFIQTAEGRARKSGTNFLYEYNLTDHLGNVRASVDATGTVVQRDGYYPFGLTFNHSNVSPENDYKYNGFEEQKETGWYDYQARYYDPALGRFLNVDPAADLMRRHSTYSYAFNNPIRFIDPDGMMPSDQADHHTDHLAASAATNDFDPHRDMIGADWFEDPMPRLTGGGGKKKKKKSIHEDGDEVPSDVPYNPTLNFFEENSSYLSQAFSVLGEASIGAAQKLRQTKNVYGRMSTEVDVKWNLKRPIMSSGGHPVGFSSVTTKHTHYIAQLVRSWHSVSKFGSKALNTVRVAGNYGGIALTFASVGFDYKDWNNGTLSTGRFSYRTVTSGLGLGAAYYFGGPYGIAVGVLAIGGEKAYDATKPVRRNIGFEYSRFVEALKYWH